jgi:hypothetical protein
MKNLNSVRDDDDVIINYAGSSTNPELQAGCEGEPN